MYADDTHLTYADNDICSLEASLNQDLLNINNWLFANKLTLNMTKTEFMLIGSRQKLNSLSVLPDWEINGTQLNRVDFTKSLGVLIDENLTWSNHINAISKKISSGIGSIKRISRCVPPATLHNIYHGLVQSHFDYCSVVWGNCAKTLSDKLQRLQNRAVRVLTHSSYDADANLLLKEQLWQARLVSGQALRAPKECLKTFKRVPFTSMEDEVYLFMVSTQLKHPVRQIPVSVSVRGIYVAGSFIHHTTLTSCIICTNLLNELLQFCLSNISDPWFCP